MKTYKCGNKYCKNGNIVDRDIAVKIGAKYYCPECAKEVDGKKKIREKYIEYIDKVPNMSQLNLAIKKVVNDYGCDIDLVLYAIKYVKTNKIPMNNPFGLTWVIKDDKMIKKYKKEIVTKKANLLIIEMDKEQTYKKASFKRNVLSKPKWMEDI